MPLSPHLINVKPTFKYYLNPSFLCFSLPEQPVSSCAAESSGSMWHYLMQLQCDLPPLQILISSSLQFYLPTNCQFVAEDCTTVASRWNLTVPALTAALLQFGCHIQFTEPLCPSPCSNFNLSAVRHQWSQLVVAGDRWTLLLHLHHLTSHSKKPKLPWQQHPLLPLPK
jgi:hypothetical protein